MITLLAIPAFLSIDAAGLVVILLIISLPLFFFWRWIYRKLIKDSKTRLIVTWLSTIVATPLIYAGLVWAIFVYITYYPPHQFDKKFWVENREKRYEVADDLIRSKILVGKSQLEITQLLGNETLNSDATNNNLVYFLGFKPNFVRGVSVLVVDFKDGKVIKVSQHL